jgi:hypothetical protein
LSSIAASDAYVLGVPSRAGGRRGGACIWSHPKHFNQNSEWQEVRPEEGPIREAQGDLEGPCHTQDRAHGEPLGAISVIGIFNNQCSCLVREHVPITHMNWRKVLEGLKEKVWRDLKKRFEYPPNQFNEDLCRGHAMVIVGKALRNLRSRLNKLYLKKGKTPFEDYNFIKRHEWEEFIGKMSTDEAKAKGEKYSELTKRNMHHHHIGMIGYTAKRLKWQQKEREAAEAG